ncbi:peptide maturation system protein (TIGR04066 family) [Ruminiclostridium sufflavum DSM 19573]|uniref:Peptide maturation system protein (TIGR04066 family) n=1 Tax=Ruminiclostridium sufflavum DSM 19573 TaxID=1121337 RepID=A0A318XQP4_9FIRM|nr:TIGR04066 family peptide maturation system protein [Ruminiclostridium sufflavum]PYG89726.1 peptide maturation system protein (TIGR04066 family) [Ruminiclostridium sufflavum DSM 19573]
MRKNERLLIYPYNMEFTPVLRHRSLLMGYEISCLVAPNGWGFTGKDAGIADRGPDIGISVAADFEKSLDLCDTVMIIKSHLPFDFDKYIFNKIKLAVKLKKNIICSLKLDREAIKEISSMCNCEGVYFKYFDGTQNVLPEEIVIDNESIEEIDTPVILTVGISEKTNKFEIQLALREKIQKLGYKISQIGTRSYCEMIGFHSFPSFMYGNAISDVNKVLMFNRFIKKIEKTEEPDIISIGVPGGIMPLNRKFTNNFGLFAFEISQAVVPDVVIASMLYEDYKPEGFDTYTNLIKYRLGFEVDFFNIANMQFDWKRANQEHVRSYTSLDYRFIDEKKMKYSSNNIPVLNILNKSDSNFMADQAIKKLVGYADVQIV